MADLLLKSAVMQKSGGERETCAASTSLLSSAPSRKPTSEFTYFLVCVFSFYTPLTKPQFLSSHVCRDVFK